MDIVVKHYILDSLSSFIYSCLRVCIVSSALLKQLLRLCLGAVGPFVVRGTTIDLEKNYPDMY